MEADNAPQPAFRLIARLALASALGVAAAMMLAGLGMLLPAPAYAAPGGEAAAAFRTASSVAASRWPSATMLCSR
jgi:hypothetical protein